VLQFHAETLAHEDAIVARPYALAHIVKRVTVFCGSSPGARPEYLDAAMHFGHVLATRKIGLVYGGSRVGTMGALARATLDAGGEVFGVIPTVLIERELAFDGLSELKIVETIHDRKGLMLELGDAVVALPGGLGTLEEFFEAVSWAQLGLHRKPFGLLNVCGYYDRLIEFLDHAVDQGFLKPEHHRMLVVDDAPEGLLDRLQTLL